MAAPALDKQRIHAAIMSLVESCTFVKVKFSPGGAGGMTMATGDENDAVRPTSVVLDEVHASFRPALRNRQTMTFEKSEWRFQLHLGFPCAVSLEELEARLTESGIVLPANRADGTRQIRIALVEAPYLHPPQGQPANGTLVRLTLSAEVGPK